MTDAVKLLDILESQMLSFAAQATAAADIAGMLKKVLTGGAQGATAEQSDADDILSSVVIPRTFGDGRGAKLPTGRKR